jgi:predicted metalloprotease
MRDRRAQIAGAIAAVVVLVLFGVFIIRRGEGTSPPPVPPTDSTTTSAPTTTLDAAASNCSIGQIDEDNDTCKGPERPGIETLEVYFSGNRIPTFTGTIDTNTMDGYLTKVINHVAGFWTAVYAKYGIKSQGKPFESSVHFKWLDNGEVIKTACGRTDLRTMFYCPPSDTIYISVPAIYADWTGKPLPDESSHEATDEGSAIYTVAHEYAHNVQQEIGINPAMTTFDFEQEADCLAGVYLRGGIDLDSHSSRANFHGVLANADFSGDYEFEEPGHHGTPDERMIAILEGHNTSDPSHCDARYETV